METEKGGSLKKMMMFPIKRLSLASRIIIILMVASALVTSLGMAAADYVDGLKKTITLEDDGKAIQLTTMEKTVGDVLKTYDVQLKAGDRVEPARNHPLEDGMKISVKRAMTVFVSADISRKQIRMIEGDVEDALQRAGVELREHDEVSPPLNEPVSPGMFIRVTRVDKEIITERKSIPYDVVIRKDKNLLIGKEKVAQAGRKGKQEIKIEVIYKDGVEVSRELVSDEVVRKPVDKIVLRGTAKPKPVQVASRSSSERSSSSSKKKSGSSSSSSSKSSSGTIKGYEYKEVKVMEATAYTYTGRKTATGRTTKRGIVAVDPRVIPLGTRLYIEGYGFGEAQDVGGGVKGNKIDLFMETRSECLRWGRRPVKVYILK
jgi:uncharacterized protein YabE (DUF348 family)